MSAPDFGSTLTDATARGCAATTCDSANPAPMPTTKVIAISVPTNAGRSLVSEVAIRLVVIDVSSMWRFAGGFQWPAPTFTTHDADRWTRVCALAFAPFRRQAVSEHQRRQ